MNFAEGNSAYSPLNVGERRAKIVCTIGPACNGEEALADLMRLGMDVARLNFSHGTHDSHAQTIARLRKVATQLGRTICILQDLQGPKIRTGRLRDHTPVMLEPRSRVTITNRDVEGTPTLLATTFTTLAKEVVPGARILLSDGRLSLKVVAIHGDDVECEVVDGGLLGEHQGINLPGTVVSIPSLTEKDLNDLRFGVEQGVDAVALSFVRTAADVRYTKDQLAVLGADTPVIAKLEKPQAIDNLEEILKVADGVMVARGDLGVEVLPEKVPTLQKHIIRRSQVWRKPVITATQMLESMIENPRPTRAEASDVANAIFDGTDAVMLSGETASGKYPREAVSMMSRIVFEAEAHMASNAVRMRHDVRDLTIAEAICESVAHLAEDLKLSAIAVFTETGDTARLISEYRPRTPVYAFSQELPVRNRLNLYWGVHPVGIDQAVTLEQMTSISENYLVDRGVTRKDEVFAIVAGTRATKGSTNFIRLRQVLAEPPRAKQ